MTIQKAIEVLEYARNYDGMNYGAPSIALDMAISALRQQETVAKCNGLNEPLTMDELREMNGEPVYCVEITGREEWLFRRDGGFADMYGEFTSDDFMSWDNYGKLW